MGLLVVTQLRCCKIFKLIGHLWNLAKNWPYLAQSRAQLGNKWRQSDPLRICKLARGFSVIRMVLQHGPSTVSCEQHTLVVVSARMPGPRPGASCLCCRLFWNPLR